MCRKCLCEEHNKRNRFIHHHERVHQYREIPKLAGTSFPKGGKGIVEGGKNVPSSVGLTGWEDCSGTCGPIIVRWYSVEIVQKLIGCAGSILRSTLRKTARNSSTSTFVRSQIIIYELVRVQTDIEYSILQTRAKLRLPFVSRRTLPRN